jgi:hypothetical protein
MFSISFFDFWYLHYLLWPLLLPFSLPAIVRTTLSFLMERFAAPASLYTIVVPLIFLPLHQPHPWQYPPRSSYSLPQHPSILASGPPAFSLAGQVLREQLVQPRQRGYPRHRAATPLRTHIRAHARVVPPPPCTPLAPVEIMYTYVIKIAEGE